MRIIDKKSNKDYYDYLVGIYGVEPKLILDRRNAETRLAPHFCLIICGNIIEGCKIDDKFYYGEELKQIESKPSDSKDYVYVNLEPTSQYIRHYKISTKIYVDKDNYNEKYEIPILMITYDDLSYKYRYNRTPRENEFGKMCNLSKLGLGRFISAETIYQWLTQWLGCQVERLMDHSIEQTDVQKLTNKGFDKKISFRPNMKR